MAVYTRISSDQLRSAAADLGLTLVAAPRDVEDGIENTTYFFEATAPHSPPRGYVLTILENTVPDQMLFSARLCRYLADRDLPVPAPLAARSGATHLVLGGKPALVFPRAPGIHPARIEAGHCRQIGSFMARMHRAGDQFTPRLKNSRGLPWLRQSAAALAPCLGRDDVELLWHRVSDWEALTATDPQLPAGAIHGDLFSDNALFEGTALSAVIDFYNACTDWLLLDIAIAVNDWCATENDGVADDALAQTLLEAYRRIRPFTSAEKRHWQTVLALAATRFWVSRLLGVHRPDLLGGEVRTKDPEPYRRLLLKRLETVPVLP